MSNIKIRNLESATESQIVSGNYVPIALNTEEGQPALTKKATFSQVVSGGITSYSGNANYIKITGGLYANEADCFSLSSRLLILNDDDCYMNPTECNSMSLRYDGHNSAVLDSLASKDKSTTLQLTRVDKDDPASRITWSLKSYEEDDSFNIFCLDNNGSKIDNNVNFYNPVLISGQPILTGTASSLITQFNQQSSQENEGLDDFVQNSDGDTIPNPNKTTSSEIEMVDTNNDGIPDREILINTSILTANNLGEVIQPGGGLETVDHCMNENYDSVACNDPGVKYKTTKLSLATSAENLAIYLRINEDEGKPLNQGSLHVAREPDGITVTDKFKNMSDAYSWIKQNVSSSRIIVELIYETDTTEPEYAQSLIQTNENLGQINHWGEDAWKKISGQLGGNTGDLKTINISSNSESRFNRLVFDIFNTTHFSGLHFNIDTKDKGDELYGVFRTNNVRTSIHYCKFTVKGSRHISRIFEAREGGSLYIYSSFPRAQTLGYEDPFNKGNNARSHALELDLTGLQVQTFAELKTVNDGIKFTSQTLGPEKNEVTFEIADGAPGAAWDPTNKKLTITADINGAASYQDILDYLDGTGAAALASSGFSVAGIGDTNQAASIGSTTSGVGFSVGYIFDADISSFLSLQDYRPGSDRTLSGIHFTGTGETSMISFFNLNSASTIRINTSFTRSDSCTINCNTTFNAFGYNPISFGPHTDEPLAYATLPGTTNTLAAAPADYTVNVAFGNDDAIGPVSNNNLPVDEDYF